MENMKFKSDYAKAWLPLAHVLGGIGNGIFVFICFYEYDILFRLWGSAVWAIITPVFLETLQWFFSKTAVKQRIFEEQTAQAEKMEAHMNNFCLTERNQQLRDAEKESFIEKQNLLLLRGDKIPPSAINGWLIYSFVVVTLVISTLVITLNRNESNQKIVNTEVDIELHKLDSLHTEQIEIHRENNTAAINVIVASGSVDSEKSSSLNGKIQEIESKMATAKANKEVIGFAALRKSKNALTQQLHSLPLSQEYEKQKAEKLKEFTSWKLLQDTTHRLLKEQKEKTIREKHKSKGTRINWFAVLTNLLYVVFQYVIVKIRTITGMWSFDLIELIGELLIPRPKLHDEKEAVTATTEETEIPNATIDEKKKQEPTPSVVIEEKIQDEPKEPTPSVKVVKMEITQPEPKKRVESPSKILQTPTSTTYSKHNVHYEELKLSHLQQFFEDNEIKNIIGYTSAEQIWSALKNGRKAILAGKTDSKSVKTMNDLLEFLADKYEIVANPNEKTIETMTPRLCRRIIELNQKIV